MAKAKVNMLNLGDAMLQGAREPLTASSVPIMPTSEMPMILTLDEVAPNPDNPRTTRNPKYDEIKDSIRARGLDTVPKITRNPELPGSPYIFSDGGNTRYAILRELYSETGNECFYRFHVLFKPWPGRLECLVGHLAENDVRGDLTFIEKALGIRKARSIHEETLGRSVTLRELSDLMREQGYPIHNSLISRMEHTVDYLYPYMPELLSSGLGYPQVVQLLSLRTACEKVWKQYSRESTGMMAAVFGDVCRQFDDPELYSLSVFRDELIGHLIQVLPHPSLNYDRWLIELDPKTQNQHALFGVPEPVPEHLILADYQAWQSVDIQNEKVYSREQTLISGQENGESAERQGRSDAAPLSSDLPSGRNEIQSDMWDGPDVLSGEVIFEDAETDDKSFLTSYARGETTAAAVGSVTAYSQVASSTVGSADVAGRVDFTAGSNLFEFREHSDLNPPPSPELSAITHSSVAFANMGLEPVCDIWAISSLQDDIEHLQDMAYRLVFETAEAMGCEDSIQEDNRPDSAGFTVSPHGNEFVFFLAGLSGDLPNNQVNMFMFCLNFFGSQSPGDVPVFDDIHVVKIMRLIRVIRRLRELQRQVATGREVGCNECGY